MKQFRRIALTSSCGECAAQSGQLRSSAYTLNLVAEVKTAHAADVPPIWICLHTGEGWRTVTPQP